MRQRMGLRKWKHLIQIRKLVVKGMGQKKDLFNLKTLCLLLHCMEHNLLCVFIAFFLAAPQSHPNLCCYIHGKLCAWSLNIILL